MVIIGKKKIQTLEKKITNLIAIVKEQHEQIEEWRPVIDKARLAMGIEALKDSKEKQDLYDEWLYGEDKKK